MNWLHYLIEANIYLAVFYACYCLFLNKETHYSLNRAYLLLSCFVSFMLPVIQIGALKPAVKLPEVTPISYVTAGSPAAQPAVVEHITLDDALWCAYIAGIAVLTLLLVIKLFRLVNLTTSGKTLIDNKYKLIDVEDADTAFSFFNYLFIGTKTTASAIIIQHELVHIRQKHSADIMFMELIKIVNWFNPVVYLVQISLKTVHEYIADEQTAAQGTDAIAYSSFLVDNAYGLNGPSVTHSFFNYNLLKKRIIMLNQQRSGKLARLKYLVAIPVCAGMLCASTLAFSKNYALIDLLPNPVKATTKIVKRAATDTAMRRIKTKATTSKGYNYEETGYLINNKTDFRVIITDKGDQKEYYKSKAKPEELAMLKEKYGYSFPKMIIYPKMPPPPPMPPASQPGLNKMPPPPPPAPPKHGAKNMRRMPPPPPPSPGSDDVNKTPPPPPAPPVGSKDLVEIVAPLQPVSPKAAKKLKLKLAAPAPPADIIEQPVPTSSVPVAAPADVKPADKESQKDGLTNAANGHPLIIVNGTKYIFKQKIKSGQKVYCAADDSTVVTTDHLAFQVKKWGNEAKNGVIELYGKNVAVNVR